MYRRVRGDPILTAAAVSEKSDFRWTMLALDRALLELARLSDGDIALLAEEVAYAVVMLASPLASWITGVCLPVDGAQGRSNI
jgi:NAD(P)-dependent dehydrogenase (short-subunit alcohol dehydrogenase family)